MLLELKEVWRTKRKAEKSSRSKCVPRRERVLHEDRGIDGGISDTDPRAAKSRVKVVERQLRGQWSNVGGRVQVGKRNDMIGVA